MERETIYDHPGYYDILFGWDRAREADFYHRTFLRCGVATTEPLLEVACGTGQVARLLAGRGWRVTGLDLRPGMLAFLRDRAAEDRTRVETLCADMTSFGADVKFAAAYNPMSSFRLLPTDAAAQAHLLRTSAALRPGGIYVLDLDFLARPDEPAVTTDEAWEMTRGDVTVRADDAAVHVRDGEVDQVLAWGREAHLRGYTAAEFAALVGATARFRIESWHPETSRATGVSEFPVDDPRSGPPVGRSMVVLRRA